MSKPRIPGLPYVDGGYVVISDQDSLNQVLAFAGTELSDVIIAFRSPDRSLDDSERTEYLRFLGSAFDQVITAGILPRPNEPLPDLGTRVEVMSVGGKPSPASRYHTGFVSGYEWMAGYRCWYVATTYDQPGRFHEYPVWGCVTWPGALHVVGSDERAFSTMTPEEIEALFYERRMQG